MWFKSFGWSAIQYDWHGALYCKAIASNVFPMLWGACSKLSRNFDALQLEKKHQAF
jgi:hypothetical protein